MQILGVAPKHLSGVFETILNNDIVSTKFNALHPTLCYESVSGFLIVVLVIIQSHLGFY